MISNGDPVEYMYLCDKIPLPGVLRSKTLKEWENSINIFPLRTRAGRHGGLMVSAFDSAACGPGLTLAGDIVLWSWARHLTLTVPLSTQVYKWVPANLMLGGNPAMD